VRSGPAGLRLTRPYAAAARTPAAVTVVYSAVICSAVMPAAMQSKITLTGTPVPAITAWPCITAESAEIIAIYSPVTVSVCRAWAALDNGNVYFGFGGNAEDCGKYKGRVVSVPEAGGTPRFFKVDPAPGENNGGVWMGGGAPAVSPNGDIWVTTGNGSLNKHPYDYSDGVLELSPSLHLLQFFAPASWRQDNANDLDFSTEPILLPDGQVIGAGKNQVLYLLNGRHLGGIGKQQAKIGPVCSTNIDGGSAHVGMTAFLPCESGVLAVQATRSPPALHVLWAANVSSGPPIVAGGLVWTIGQNGKLYGLDPATGKIRQQAAIGAPANHFPTPGIGAGLMLVPSAQNVVAFRAPGTGVGAGQGAGVRALVGTGGRMIAEVALACLVAVGAFGWFIWLIRRRRQA
jgi:outer membrane protein assembly factor BamB